MVLNEQACGLDVIKKRVDSLYPYIIIMEKIARVSALFKDRSRLPSQHQYHASGFELQRSKSSQ